MISPMPSHANAPSAQAIIPPPARLWFGARAPGPQTRLFRRTLHLAAPPQAAQWQLYAESIYQCWVNGHYVGRGPAFHHPTRPALQSYEVSHLLQAGANVLAVLVHYPDLSTHNHVPADAPGLVTQLVLGQGDSEQIVGADAHWKATDRTGWREDGPRRCWALAYIEHFDQRQSPSVQAPDGRGEIHWTSPVYDDTLWQPATVEAPATTAPSAQWGLCPLPPLRYAHQPPRQFMGAYGIDQPPAPITRTPGAPSIGADLLAAKWQENPSFTAQFATPAPDRFTVHGLSRQSGAILCFDMGSQVTGQVTLECRAQTAGIVDIGWAECIVDGRPAIVRKGVSYCDRIELAGGTLRWEPIHFSSMRYLMVALRGFEGEVSVQRLGVRVSEPALDWPVAVQFGEERAQGIARLCVNTLRVGVQEGLMDCPTREQAPYVADGQLIARWLAQVSGDARHWRYLVSEQFLRQAPNGLIRSSVFSGGQDTLLDYSLLGVVGTRDYLRYSDDRQTVAQWIDACRRVLGWFEARREPSGLCVTNRGPVVNTRAWDFPYDPHSPQMREEDNLMLFIDHPGMGWHNVTEAGIDRRGTNAALNALIILAQRALADLEEAVGEPPRAEALRSEASALAAQVRQSFFDPQKGLFVDGIHEGKPLSQISEQTNTWAIAAGCCTDEEARRIIIRLLDDPDPAVARNGPYFWAYLLPEMARLGLHRLALDRIAARWGPMLDGGATTLWETFTGDHLDTWCHPWSGAPIEFYLTHVLGLPGLDSPDEPVVLRPRADLMAQAAGQVGTRHGMVSMAWQTEGKKVKLQGTLPGTLRGRLILPEGERQVSGSWMLETQMTRGD
jgi:hypothetical protein